MATHETWWGMRGVFAGNPGQGFNYGAGSGGGGRANVHLRKGPRSWRNVHAPPPSDLGGGPPTHYPQAFGESIEPCRGVNYGGGCTGTPSVGEQPKWFRSWRHCLAARDPVKEAAWPPHDTWRFLQWGKCFGNITGNCEKLKKIAKKNLRKKYAKLTKIAEK